MKAAAIAAILLLGLGASPASQALCPAPDADETWTVVSIAGRRAGSGHEHTTERGDGTRQTQSQLRLALNRLQARLEMSELDLEVEDADGRLLRVESELLTSREATRLVLEVEGEQLHLTTSAGGRSYRRDLTGVHVLLGPEGVRERTCTWLASPGAPLEYEVFMPDLGATARVTRRFLGREPPGADARARYRIEQRTEGVADPSSLLLDDSGSPLEEAADTPLGRMVMTRASAAEAARAVSGAELGDDAYAHSLLASNVRLPTPRALERLRVRLSSDRADLDWPDLEGPNQHVVAREPNARVLEITRAAALPDLVPDATADDPALAPNVLLQSDHPDVVALARTLRRPGLGAFAQARVLQSWVATHLQFDAGLAVVPAGEAVRDRRGSCVAYAVLTASLARALGIPARVVLGYVYVSNVFAGHAWTEVRVGHTWRALDAAVYGAGPADAARIALVRHGGETGITSGALELGRLVGAVSVRVEGFERHGRWRAVARGAPAWTVRDGRYRNPWLGLQLQAPAGHVLERLDAHYPDALVLASRGPGDAHLELRQLSVGVDGGGSAELLRARGYPAGRDLTVAGRPGQATALGSRRALAFADGTDLWLLEADGVDATTFAAVSRSIRLEP